MAEPDEEEWPFKNMIGLQFFLEADVRFVRGHTMCADSPWGVTYVSQAQYWGPNPRALGGCRGVISAIITRLGRPAKVGEEELRAVDCTADQLARGVWQQIRDTLTDVERDALADPLYYYVDDNVEFAPDGPMRRNHLPYLVNTVRRGGVDSLWQRRPGYRSPDADYEYLVQVGRVVLAGHFMRTHTRLTTMESANESGRRAVNAILAADDRALQPCRTWRLEEALELNEVRQLRRLDERMWSQGARHVLDTVGAEWFYRAVPWDLLRLAAAR